MSIYIALGSNLGDRKKNLDRAITYLAYYDVEVVKKSTYIETEPYGVTDQGKFLNAVISVRTRLDPQKLLGVLLTVERAMGRIRREHWGPRIIDLDLLSYGDEIIHTRHLTLPHPEMAKRAFVLEPLREIAPDYIHPVTGKSIDTMLEELPLTEELDWLESTARFGVKLGLENTKKLLERLGSPEKDLKILHVAGTNGKGSVSTYLAECLKAEGYRVGLFLSPFVENFSERIQLSDEDASKLLAAHLKEVHEVVDELAKEDVHCTHFEILTGLALKIFAAEKVDYVVLEVGLGGRFDATNVIEHPLASIITHIDLDHTDVLGDTIAKIAFEKAGIIKEDVPVYVYPSAKDAMQVFEDVAKEKHAELTALDPVAVKEVKVSLDGTTFLLKGVSYKLAMLGKHQAMNAALVVTVLKDLRKRNSLDITDTAIAEGLQRAKIIARTEILATEPTVLLDGSHNPDGIRALCDLIDTIPHKNLYLVLGILADKNHLEMVKNLVPRAKKTVTTIVPSPRALDARTLAKEAAPYGDVAHEDLPAKAVERILSYADRDDLIVMTGSLYLAGDLRRDFERLARRMTDSSAPFFRLD